MLLDYSPFGLLRPSQGLWPEQAGKCMVTAWGGGDMVLGEMDVAQVKPSQTSQGDPHCTRELVRTPPVSGGHQLSGGDSRSISCLVDDVHQARSTKSVGDGDEPRRGQKKSRLLVVISVITP